MFWVLGVKVLLPGCTAELWHGPTLAFKDLGMQVLAQILSYFLSKKNNKRKGKPSKFACWNKR